MVVRVLIVLVALLIQSKLRISDEIGKDRRFRMFFLHLDLSSGVAPIADYSALRLIMQVAVALGLAAPNGRTGLESYWVYFVYWGSTPIPLFWNAA